MKTKLLFALMMISSLFLLPACDKCKDVECNHGTCDKGDCDCDYGYYGSHCQYEETWHSSTSSGSTSSGSTSSGSTSSGSTSSGSTSSGSTSSGGSNTCTTNVTGCSPSQYSCDASPYCYNSYADCAASGTCASSGGSTSGSSSTGSTSSSSGGGTGQVTFYTRTDWGCGTITVTVSGYGSGYVSVYYSGGISDCGASGCATYTLAPGQYTMNASCSSYTWGPYNFTVTSGGCLLWELQ